MKVLWVKVPEDKKNNAVKFMQWMDEPLQQVGALLCNPKGNSPIQSHDGTFEVRIFSPVTALVRALLRREGLTVERESTIGEDEDE